MGMVIDGARTPGGGAIPGGGAQRPPPLGGPIGVLADLASGYAGGGSIPKLP